MTVDFILYYIFNPINKLKGSVKQTKKALINDYLLFQKYTEDFALQLRIIFL